MGSTRVQLVGLILLAVYTAHCEGGKTVERFENSTPEMQPMSEKIKKFIKPGYYGLSPFWKFFSCPEESEDSESLNYKGGPMPRSESKTCQNSDCYCDCDCNDECNCTCDRNCKQSEKDKYEEPPSDSSCDCPKKKCRVAKRGKGKAAEERLVMNTNYKRKVSGRDHKCECGKTKSSEYRLNEDYNDFFGVRGCCCRKYDKCRKSCRKERPGYSIDE